MTAAIHQVVEALDGVFVWYFVGLNAFYGALFVLAVWDTLKNWTLLSRLHLEGHFRDETFPPVSIVVPAHDEERHIVSTVRAQLELDYPEHEVVVVNDGSSDGTLDRLIEAFDLFEVPPAFPRRLETAPVRGYYRSRTDRRVLVVDKENGGKADALNAGIDAARYPYCATVDADTIIERQALRRIVRPILTGRRVGGCGGTIRIGNDCVFRGSEVTESRVPRNPLAALQVPEYLRAFLFGRLGWNYLGGNLILSGAFAFFRRDLLREVGGFEPDSVTEDLEVVVGLHRRIREAGGDEELRFVPDPVGWTEVPETRQELGRQRERWQRGLILSLLRNARMFFNPRYGLVGTVVMPFYLLGEALAPVMEVAGYLVIGAGVAVGALDLRFAGLFLAVALGWQMMITLASVCVEELTYRQYPRLRDFLRMLLYAVLEPFGYRQLTVWWRLKACARVLRGDRGGEAWSQERQGHDAA